MSNASGVPNTYSCFPPSRKQPSNTNFTIARQGSSLNLFGGTEIDGGENASDKEGGAEKKDLTTKEQALVHKRDEAKNIAQELVNKLIADVIKQVSAPTTNETDVVLEFKDELSLSDDEHSDSSHSRHSTSFLLTEASGTPDTSNIMDGDTPKKCNLGQSIKNFNKNPARRLNTSIMTFTGLLHAVLSVNYPDPTPTLLSTTVGIVSNGLYGAASVVCGLSSTQQWSNDTNKKIASFIESSSIFFGNTEFAYETLARVIGLNLPGDYDSEALESILMYGVSIIAPMLGAYMAYKAQNAPTRDQWDWGLYEICKLLSLSFTAGSFVGSIENLLNLFGITEESSTKNIVILLTQLITLFVYIPLRYKGKQELLKEISTSLTACNIFISVGSWLANAAVLTAKPFPIILNGLITVWYMGTNILGKKGPNFLNPFNYVPQLPSNRQPLLPQ